MIHKSVSIVYYAYLNPDAGWAAIISGQLEQLKSYGISAEANIYIHFTDCFGLLQQAVTLVKSIVPNAIISSSTINQYEYPGIKLVHDLAINNPNHIYIYFHTKGMSYGNRERSNWEKTLFTKTFENWQLTIAELRKPGMNKAALFFEKQGWAWYNFWYAKGSYLANCQAPQITEDRYAYEAWLGRASANKAINNEDCVHILQLDGTAQKTFYLPSEADIQLEAIMKKLFGDPPAPVKKKSTKLSSLLKLFKKT